MKKLLLLLVAMIATVGCANAHELIVLKDYHTLNVEFDYSQVVVFGKMSEQEFIQQVNIEERIGQSNYDYDFEKIWNESLKPMYHGKMMSAANHALKKKKYDLVLAEDSTADYTMRVIVTEIHDDATVKCECQVYKTGTHDIISQFKVNPHHGDGDTFTMKLVDGWRNTGEDIGNAIAKRMKEEKSKDNEKGFFKKAAKKVKDIF